MGAVAGNVGGVHDVLVYQGGVEAELQILHIDAHVAPVGRQDLLRLERHVQLPEHDRRGVVGAFEEIGMLLHHDLGVRVAARGSHGGVGGHDAVRQIEEFLHGLAAPGNVFLHLVDVGLLPEGHDCVDPLFVLSGNDQAIGLRELHPVHLRPVGVDQRADLLAGVRHADVAELVQRRLELEAAAPEARGEAAGQVVLLDQQGLEAALARGRRRRQTAIACANDDDVVLFVQFACLLFDHIICVRPSSGVSAEEGRVFTAGRQTAGSARSAAARHSTGRCS